MRWWPWGRRSRAEVGPALLDDGSLTALGSSFDPARADSAVLAELRTAGLDLDRALLVRHHLRLPGLEAVEEARRVLADDGYSVAAEPMPQATGWQVRASRAEQVSGLSLARERTRMAGLAQRLGGAASGWDLCGPREPSEPGTATGR